MQGKILALFLLLLSCMSTVAQQTDGAGYTGIEYIRLKSELCRGWNTWNTNSVLSHVLLPEAISVDFYLRDKKSGKILYEALMGRRGEDVETILPLTHTADGQYTDLEVSWKDIKMKIQSVAREKDISFLLTPLADNANGEVLVSPHEIWWDRDGKTRIDDGRLLFMLPSDTIILHAKNDNGTQDTGTNSLVFRAGTEIILSTDLHSSASDVKKEIARAKARHEEVLNSYGVNKAQVHAMQNALAWNIIYEPDEQRGLTTVSRLWNTYRGGYVIFCWDNYFAAYMHSFDNKQLAYANAIEMTNAITPSGFVPNLSASKGIKTSDRSQPPVGSFVVREIYRKYNEKWFLQEVYPKLLTWNRWWVKKRDTNGFLCWGSSPFEPYLRNLDRNAHSRFGAALESGLDNSPMYDDIPFDSVRNQLLLADVGLMSLYVLDCEALAEIADELGEEDNKNELLERAEKYRNNLKKLWDDKTGMYLNKRIDTNVFSYRLSPTNFYPLLSGVPTQEQAERMISEHFYNPDEFWGEYILPSIAFNDPGFNSSDYWRGRIWGPMNFLVYLGLCNYQLDNARNDLVAKSTDLFLKQWLENGYICENYNSKTGACNDVSRCELFYHWGALLGFISLIEEGYIPAPGSPFRKN